MKIGKRRRVQGTYKGRQKHKAKIGKLTKKPQFLGNFIFFAKCLGRVRLNTKKLSYSVIG